MAGAGPERVRAFVLREVGSGPRLEDVDEPAAGEGQAVVSVAAAGLNAVDLKQAAESAGVLPRVVGNEAVVRLDGARRYARRTISPHGSFAERAVVDPALLIDLPHEVGDADALAIGIAGLAAWVALETAARLQPGETVVVLGASGAVGQVAVQAARLLGAARVVSVGRDRAALARSLELGADEAVVVGSPDDVSALLEATHGGADVVLDPVFGPPLVAALRATRPGARVVSIGSSARPEATVPFAALRGRSMLTYSNQLTDADVKRAAYTRMLAHLLSGELRVDAEVVGLDQAPSAWQRQASTPRTKLVIVP